MGYEYELIRKFAQDHDLVLNMVIARNMSNMIDMLNRGEGDIIAYDVPITGDTERCGNALRAGDDHASGVGATRWKRSEARR